MKTLVLILSLFLITGCATRTIYVDRIVKVPEIVLEQCPLPAEVQAFGVTPIQELTKESKPDDVAKAYVRTVNLQSIKITEYKTALDAVNNEPK